MYPHDLEVQLEAFRSIATGGFDQVESWAARKSSVRRDPLRDAEDSWAYHSAVIYAYMSLWYSLTYCHCIASSPWT